MEDKRKNSNSRTMRLFHLLSLCISVSPLSPSPSRMRSPDTIRMSDPVSRSPTCSERLARRPAHPGGPHPPERVCRAQLLLAGHPHHLQADRQAVTLRDPAPTVRPIFTVEERLT